jgi:hypothetical protein
MQKIENYFHIIVNDNNKLKRPIIHNGVPDEPAYVIDDSARIPSMG